MILQEIAVVLQPEVTKHRYYFLSGLLQLTISRLIYTKFICQFILLISVRRTRRMKPLLPLFMYQCHLVHPPPFGKPHADQQVMAMYYGNSCGGRASSDAPRHTNNTLQDNVALQEILCQVSRFCPIITIPPLFPCLSYHYDPADVPHSLIYRVGDGQWARQWPQFHEDAVLPLPKSKNKKRKSEFELLARLWNFLIYARNV